MQIVLNAEPVNVLLNAQPANIIAPYFIDPRQFATGNCCFKANQFLSTTIATVTAYIVSLSDAIYNNK